MRWSDDYVLVEDADVDALWRARGAEERKRVYIFGDGFDPRVTTALARYLGVSAAATTLMRFGLRPSTLPNDESKAVEENRRITEELARSASVAIEEIVYPDVEDSKSAGRVAMRELFQQRRFADVDEVVVDVSALPLDVY